MIPVVMEPEVRDTKTWTGPVSFELGRKLYVDFAESALTPEKVDELYSQIMAIIGHSRQSVIDSLLKYNSRQTSWGHGKGYQDIQTDTPKLAAAKSPVTTAGSAKDPFKEMLKTDTRGPLSLAKPYWVTCLAFSSTQDSTSSNNKLFVRRYQDGKKSVTAAASYILVSVEAHTNMHDSLRALLGRLPSESMTSVWVEVCPGFEQMVAIHFNFKEPSESMTSVWVEVCPGFEQMVAIHFNFKEVDLFDTLLLVSRELKLYSCADSIHIVEGGTSSSDSNSHLEESILWRSMKNDLSASAVKLSIIDTPISTQHAYLEGRNIHQEDFGVEHIHGTHVAGIAIQMNPNIQLYSFPAAYITTLVDVSDRSREDIKVFFGERGRELSGISKLSAALKDFLNSDTRVVNISGERGRELSGISKLSAALKDFLNSDTRVVNISAGISAANENAIAFITPLMKRLREKGLIITVAAGNSSTNFDVDENDLLIHFVNKEITEEIDGVRRSFRMDNIVAVAACNKKSRLAKFSNYGSSKVLLAAPGVGIRSCTEVPDLYKSMNGTSQAAPQVAAILAMMWRKRRELSGISKLSAALKDFLNSDTRVVNISAGISAANDSAIEFITPLMKRLREKGLIITVAAGNSSTNFDVNENDLLIHFVNKEITEEIDGVMQSFRMDNIVAVAASNKNDENKLARFSNYGRNKVLLAALGVRIRSCTEVPDLYKSMNGTSQAAPQVAATLAMMLELAPNLTHTQVIDCLKNSVDKIDVLKDVKLARFSNYGSSKVLLAALGVRIWSCTEVPDLYKSMNGTSQAAPQVAATLAMMLELAPNLTHTQVIDCLKNSVDKIDVLKDVTISGGILNISRALNSAREFQI
eukprot:CAMPEP_0201114566 /NCGR_PEP_ID=MMETSP0812-20130820/78458_1 /ASSEMBLY_ACC=CAM_ASM_000668 /TAXON_ID=98059 /ORGANISM="Dinobryon sp., Strain UTEXLB2267" /LENGTH=865 /DNA_ID=CAMNT_0047378207 /DNA_START=688 /DNA_END=3287 /DNA_ORIENTATION=+